MNPTLAGRKPSHSVPEAALAQPHEFARLWLGDLVVINFGAGRRIGLINKWGHDRQTGQPVIRCYVYSRAAGAWTLNPRRVERRDYVSFISHQVVNHRGSGGQEWETPATEPRDLREPALAEALAVLTSELQP